MDGNSRALNLFLLQLSDSAVPIGGYSNSWGFETLIQRGALADAAAVKEAIEALLISSVAPQDGAACGLSWRLGQERQSERFLYLNDCLTAGRWASETLKASLSMGQRLKQLSLDAWLPEHRIDARSFLEQWPGERIHHCAAFGWISCAVGIPQLDTVSAYLYSACASLASACLRLVPLGHTDGQRILADLHPVIHRLANRCLDVRLEEIGGFAPLQEWASREHESLYSRLFQS